MSLTLNPTVDYWEPIHNPTQKQAYNSSALFLLVYGGRASGKTRICLDALVRHCYDEDDALAIILSPSIRQGKEGVFDDLEAILDIWKNGNKEMIDGIETGSRIDEGMGLDYTPPALDPQTKDRVIYITNRHGTRSKVLLVSIPHHSMVKKRMKALSPSFVYVDEIAELESASYFRDVVYQLCRRKNINGPQQYYASCNPEGPSHWVYNIFFERCIDADGNRNPDYEVYHIPIQENYHNLPPGYYEKQIAPNLVDETDRARLLEGRWVDRPSGDSIFKDYFRPDHIRPNLGTKEHREGYGLNPWPNQPIFCGYDPGARNYCITFLQMIPVKDGKIVWIVFDELIFVGEGRPDTYVADAVLKKMDFWKAKLNGNCQFVHVADQSAFTHLRGDGNFDATRMKFLTKGRVVMRPFLTVERGSDSKGSVAARIGMIRNLLRSDCLFISATCPRTIEAVKLLASEKTKEGKYDDMAGLKPKRSIYLHPFDSLSYPIFYTQLVPAAFVPQTAQNGGGVFRAGRG